MLFLRFYHSTPISSLSQSHNSPQFVTIARESGSIPNDILHVMIKWPDTITIKSRKLGRPSKILDDYINSILSLEYNGHVHCATINRNNLVMVDFVWKYSTRRNSWILGAKYRRWGHPITDCSSDHVTSFQPIMTTLSISEHQWKILYL